MEHPTISQENAFDVTEAKRKRHAQRMREVRKRKEELRSIGQDCCEICGWKAPDFLQLISHRRVFAVNLHHILPVVCGGTEEPENLILLCPNHHAIADVLSRRLNKGMGSKINCFITDRDDLIATLRRIDSDPLQAEIEMRERFIKMQGEASDILAKLFGVD